MKKQNVSFQRAQESLQAAKILIAEGLPNIAVSRAYYTMFYLAEALLADRGLSFSSHSAVIAAYGKEFGRTKDLDPDFHRYLIASQDARLIGDYGGEKNITSEEAAQIVKWAEEFLFAADAYLSQRE